jgi:predicted MPP superfamily phosphohydrolase
VIILSAEIYKEKLLFFRKKQILMISDLHIYIVDKNKKFFKKKDSLGKGDLLAITQSLMVGQHNFILHFKGREDQELFSEK